MRFLADENLHALLLRLRNPSVTGRIARLTAVWSTFEARLRGGFIVVSDHRVRLRSVGGDAAAGRP